MPGFAEFSLDIGEVRVMLAGGFGVLQSALDINESINGILNFLPLFGGHVLIVPWNCSLLIKSPLCTFSDY